VWVGGGRRRTGGRFRANNRLQLFSEVNVVYRPHHKQCLQEWVAPEQAKAGPGVAGCWACTVCPGVGVGECGAGHMGKGL